MAGVTLYGILWLEGANDLIAVHLQIPLYTTTEIARYAVFIGPVVAFWLTRRICIGLQRRDASMLTHGIETGIIVQLPNGGFEELERPATEEEAALLIEHPPASVTQPRQRHRRERAARTVQSRSAWASSRPGPTTSSSRASRWPRRPTATPMVTAATGTTATARSRAASGPRSARARPSRPTTRAE